jgi:GxxExxY protein
MVVETDSSLLYKDEVFAIQGAIFEVYKELGCGFLESVYQECLEKEFSKKNIPFTSQVELTLSYKGELLKQVYKADFVCYDKVIVELKAVNALLPEHHAQLHNYIKITDMNLGLLVNFGHFPKVDIHRIIR